MPRFMMKKKFKDIKYIFPFIKGLCFMNLISFFIKRASSQHIIHFLKKAKVYSHQINFQVNSIGITSKLNVIGEYLFNIRGL